MIAVKKSSVPIIRQTTYVVCGVTVVVNATEECGRGILPYVLLQEVWATGVLVKETTNVVDISRDADQCTRFCLTLVLERNDQGGCRKT